MSSLGFFFHRALWLKKLFHVPYVNKDPKRNTQKFKIKTLEFTNVNNDKTPIYLYISVSVCGCVGMCARVCVCVSMQKSINM